MPRQSRQPAEAGDKQSAASHHLLAVVFALDAVCTALDALFREDKLRNEASIGQAALKVMQAHREVIELYYWLPSSVSKSGRGEIDLLDYGQAACFKSGAHYRGADKETRFLFARPRQRKDGRSTGSSRNLVA